MGQNAIIGWPRWTDRCTYSGGTWDATYPRDNLRLLPLPRVARTTGLTLAATQFTAILDKVRGIRVMALVRHNISLNGRMRVRMYQADPAIGSPTPVYDGGWDDVWPAVYPSASLDWEADNWWTGKYTSDEIAGYTATRPILLPGIVLARWITVEIDDTTNADGFVQIGLFEVAQGWQPVMNLSYGYQEGFRVRTASVEALGGARYFDRRDKPRQVRGEIAYLPRDEAMARAFELIRQQDVDQPFLWFPFPDEVIHWPRTVFLARQMDPGLLTYAVFRRMTFPIALEEVL